MQSYFQINVFETKNEHTLCTANKSFLCDHLLAEIYMNSTAIHKTFLTELWYTLVYQYSLYQY